MKIIGIILLAFALSGCNTQKQAMADADDAKCAAAYKSDYAGYTRCTMYREDLREARRMAEATALLSASAAMMAPPPRPTFTTCNRTYYGVNCTSH